MACVQELQVQWLLRKAVGLGSVVEHLPSLHGVLGSVPSTRKSRLGEIYLLSLFWGSGHRAVRRSVSFFATSRIQGQPGCM